MFEKIDGTQTEYFSEIRQNSINKDWPYPANSKLIQINN